MAIKKDKNIDDEENQKFGSKYLSNTVNDMINNVISTNKLTPKAYKHLADSEESTEYIPLGVPELDKGLNGGLPRKTIVEIYGPPGGGKSYLGCYKAAASVTKNFGNVLLYDIENSFNRERAESLGVATNRILINDLYETGEQVLSSVCEFLYDPERYLKKGIPQPKWADLIIIDSIAALGSKNEMEADYVGEIVGQEGEKVGAKATVASRARMISSFQARLLKSLNHSSGTWNEVMPCSVLPDNSFYSFLPEDKNIPDSLLEDINNIVKTRQSIIDKNNPNIWKIVYYAQERRDKLDSLTIELGKMLDEDIANRLKESVENAKNKEYRDLKNEIIKQSNTESIIHKIDSIMESKLKGKEILPPIPQSIKDFEIVTNGYIYDSPSNKGIPVVHYNPGTTVVVINQVRVGNIGSFTGTTVERPGGFAFKHSAGTALYVLPITSRSKGEVKSEDGQTTAGWKSKIVIEKSRFATPKVEYEMIIPFIKEEINEFSNFMSECQKMGLWDFSRKSYVLPKDGSIIKTKDELEWKEQLLEKGLAYLQEGIGYSDAQMEPIYDILNKELVEQTTDDDNDTEDEEY